jgi:hypothetical protein
MLGEERRAIACFRLRLWCRSCTGKKIRALPPSRNWQSTEADVRVVFDDFLLFGRQLDSSDRFGCHFRRAACGKDCGWLETILAMLGDGKCSALKLVCWDISGLGR